MQVKMYMAKGAAFHGYVVDGQQQYMDVPDESEVVIADGKNYDRMVSESVGSRTHQDEYGTYIWRGLTTDAHVRGGNLAPITHKKRVYLLRAPR